MVKKSEVTHLLKFARLLDGFAIFNYAISDLGLDGRVNFTVSGSTYSLNKYTGEVEYCGVRVKLPTLRQIVTGLPTIKVFQCDGVEIPVSFNTELSKFELGTPQAFAPISMTIDVKGDTVQTELVSFDSEFSNMLFGDELPCLIEPPQEKVAQLVDPNQEEVQHTGIVIPETIAPVKSTLVKSNKSLTVYFARRNSENLLQKLPADIFPPELQAIIRPWLAATNKLSEFTQELRATPHNSIVVYLSPSYEWEIREVVRDKKITLQDRLFNQTKPIREEIGIDDEFSDELFDELFSRWTRYEYSQAEKIRDSQQHKGVFHLQTVDIKVVTFEPHPKKVSSEYVPRIMNRTKSVELRKQREAIPESGSLYEIAPILLDKKFLAQSYIVFDENTRKHERCVRKVAIQKDAKFHYYSDLDQNERDENNILELVKPEDYGNKTIFPDMGIEKICFESLNVDGNTKKDEFYKALSGYLIPRDEYNPDNHLVVKDSYGNPVVISSFCASPVIFSGFQHPNFKPVDKVIEEDGSIKTLPAVKALPTKKVKKVNLANTRSLAQNSLEWAGMIAHIPCKVTLVNSHDHWQLEALPIQSIPSYPLFYTLASKAIEQRWQEEEVLNVIITPIDKELTRLNLLAEKSTDPKMIQKIRMREANLEKLKASVLSKGKLDPKTLRECSEIVKQAINSAEYKPSPIEPYYSRYILASVYFYQTGEDNITYLLDDYMSHKRTASKVQTAINFLRILPRNLEAHFKNVKPNLKELQDYIVPLFLKKFGGESRGSLELKVRDDKGRVLIDVIYQDKIQLTQLLTIKMPASSGKNQGKVMTKVAPSIDFEDRRIFEKFLRSKDGRFVEQAMNQLKPLVQSFLSKNYSTLVGENKIGKTDKLTNIIGFNRSKQGWGQIKRGFIKYMIPFSSVSEVSKGKLIWLNSNKILNDQDLENLIIKIAENWKNWHRKDQESIKIGDVQVRNTDPQNLMFMLTKLITERPNIEEIAWKDTLDWFCEIVRLPIGFRASNGVILTPDAMYGNQLEKWEHRIKIQLIDILLNSDSGSLEGWLQCSIDRLYEAVESQNPNYEATLNPNILKHLAAMHNALSVAEKVEASKKAQF